jgi:dipeptidyl aminopeptidase/acylaminoacyl peptidase
MVRPEFMNANLSLLALKAKWLPLLLLAAPIACFAQQTYQKPPQEVLDILHAPVTPDVSISPARDRLLLIDRERYPSIAELAQPMLPLAGLRINPRNNAPHQAPRNSGIIIQTIPGGEQMRVKLPEDIRHSSPAWAPDGSQFAFAVYHSTRIDLWIADAKTGQARKVDGLALNATYGAAFQWMPDSQTLLCRTIPENRGLAPVPPTAPVGPEIQESYGTSAPARTFQDLLKSAHDEALFEYYTTSQFLLVDSATGSKPKWGEPRLYGSVDPSPDGQQFLVTLLRRPFSRLLPVSGFARDIEVWDRNAKTLFKLASLPSNEGVPIQGVPTGPRSIHWRPTANAMLVWAEALDGGDPKTKVPHRDRLLTLKAPFENEPTELLRLEHRYSGLTWGEHDGMILISDYDRDRRWRRMFLRKLDRPDLPQRLVWDRSIRDRYGDPGTPLMRPMSNGERVIWQAGDSIFLSGAGASARGDYPFLDRFDLETFETERLFHCDEQSYEFVVTLVDAAGAPRFIARHERPDSPPNYLLRTAGDSTPVALTRFTDPAPQLRSIKKQLVTYQRSDGVTLSFTLYLPPNTQPGERLPTVVWAYPLEYNDPETAGQISGSTNRFTTIAGASHLFFLMQGYAVLDGATMPIVGLPETMNDTFIEQVVASAKAAIDKAVDLGVTDPDRVGVGGHSYGAFMTANLLAHSDLFRAGIARSGAYNRSLTPFGFQGERRTLWEATDIYARLSPFTFAHRINEPILLIHGELDNNSGTFPIQSERLYHAVKGNGGHARYVTLPFESHGYAARESIEHTLYEMISWFETHVKNAPSKPPISKGPLVQ